MRNSSILYLIAQGLDFILLGLEGSRRLEDNIHYTNINTPTWICLLAHHDFRGI